jgi:site-specific recombinase XerD
MTTKEAITLFKYYIQANHKRRTIESYTLLLDRFNVIHAERPLKDISPDEIFHFLESVTQKLSKSTRRLRYAQLKAFCNFIIDRCSLNMRNPCNTPLLSKSFRAPKQLPHKILERETVDEMIFNTTRQRMSQTEPLPSGSPNRARRLKWPICLRTCRESWQNISRRKPSKKRNGYSPSATRQPDLSSRDWGPN